MTSLSYDFLTERGMRDLVKCLDCKNLVRIYIDSAFAWFEEKKKCKVKNIVFDGYYEVEKDRECEEHKVK
jgi:hypothetical protein